MLSRHIPNEVSQSVDERTVNLQRPTTEVILKTLADPKEDIARERANASFPAEELAIVLAGGKKTYDLRQECLEVLKRDPVFRKEDKYFLNRDELYKRTLAAQLAIPSKVALISHANPLEVGKIMHELLEEPGGLDLHAGMFIPTIQGQGDEEQQKYWMPLCIRTKIIGTYAQTELGHGTYLRGLETTATYDQATQEFIIHSPTLTATKWWPGGLGKTATHCVVMARLFTGGKDYGPHAFIVQIRNMGDHHALPGVIVGDIGNKMGYNAVDNGYLRFDHLRIPRRNMLMKHSKVDVDGTYHPPPVAKASYGTMVFVRSDIVMSAALFLKKAVVIAIRYNIVRRQSNMQSNGLETQVLDYQHSQRSLFPLLATAYAFHFTGNIMRKMYYQFEKASRKGGDFSALPELHATSSGLKALCTWQTKEGIELARLCCGGHGYMHLSGLPHMGGNYAPQATYEGDNNVLCLQTARYLLKAVRAATAGEPLVGNVRYLEGAGASKCALHSSAAARDPQVLRSVLEHRVARLIRVAAEDMKQNNLSDDEGFQVYMIDWIKASKAHCAYVVFLNFVEGLADAAAALPPAATAALQRLLVLHGLTSIEDNSGDFMVLPPPNLSSWSCYARLLPEEASTSNACRDNWHQPVRDQQQDRFAVL